MPRPLVYIFGLVFVQQMTCPVPWELTVFHTVWEEIVIEPLHYVERAACCSKEVQVFGPGDRDFRQNMHRPLLQVEWRHAGAIAY